MGGTAATAAKEEMEWTAAMAAKEATGETPTGVEYTWLPALSR
jgi:hypothetical protein